MVSEEVYRAYKRPIWAEHKRNDRQKLCQVSDGKGGLKRCIEDCSKCNHTKEGSVLSLDGLEVVSENKIGYPKQKVIKENGVSIVHYYPNDHGNPAHLHVIGGGQSTKIGPMGKPVKGQPNLSPKQARVINANLGSIKKVIRHIQKELRKSSNKSFAITYL